MGIFHGFRQVLPYNLIWGEKNWREQFWVFFLRTVLSTGCYFFNKGQRLYQRRIGERDQKEIPCKFDVFHPFLQ